MLRLDHRFTLSILCAVPFALSGACGEDELLDARHASDAGTDAKADAKDGGGGDVSDADAGPDLGPFGERVPVTGEQQLSGLHAAVNVVRDKHGWVHIFGRDLEDVMRVEGWMMAADRAGQLEIARRLATGRLAELFAEADPGQIDDDITMRTIGLHRAAKEIYASMDPGSEEKRALDAFANGVTQWNQAFRAGQVEPPQELGGMPPSVFTDWTPEDSLAMARLQTWSLSYDADDDISRSEKVAKVRAVFNSASSDPLAKLRAGILVDTFRFDPLDPATPQNAFPNDAPLAAHLGASAAGKGVVQPAVKVTGPSLSSDLAARASPFVRAVRRVRDLLGGDEFFGSNNWAVAGSKTATGNAMVASDPHLGLTSPMVFWPVHLWVGDGDKAELELEGVAFPGIPGVVLGSNRTLAWGATTAGYDVTDVWKEKVSADGKGVSFKGQDVAFQKVTETLKIAGKPDYTWDVLVVPHHGPLVPEIDAEHKVRAPVGQALSVRWTGHAATGEYKAVLGLAKAKNVDDARKALQPFGTGAQNWMFADSAGDVFLFSQAKLPYRNKKAFTWDSTSFSGTLPCFVLDGEKGEHEWTGAFLEESYVPKLKTPAKGWIATANTDQIGSTLDNDPSNEVLPNGKPFYIGCDFAEGLRLGRIHERLGAAAGTMTVDEMASIQADHKSGLGARLAKYLVSALQAAEVEKTIPGSHPDLAPVIDDPRYAAANVPDIWDALDKWSKDAEFEAATGLSLEDGSLVSDAKEATAARATVIFNAWLVRAIGLALGDEMQAAGVSNLGTSNMVKGFSRMLEQDPKKLATYDASTGESALWDDMTTTGTVESRNQRLVTALLDAVDDLVKIFGADRNGWRWGAVHRIRFKSLMPLWFVEVPPFGDPKFKDGFPRHGDQWNVDASNFSVLKSASSPLDFSYGSGPVQRFVAEMTPTGPKMKNALPGGAVLGKQSPFFANEVELWRRNQNHDVPFEIEEVVAAAVAPGGDHVLFRP